MNGFAVSMQRAGILVFPEEKGANGSMNIRRGEQDEKGVCTEKR